MSVGPVSELRTRRATLEAKRLARRVLPHPLYRVYRRRKVAREIASFAPRIATHDYAGHGLQVLVSDPLSEGWYDRDWPPLVEIQELSRCGAIRPGARVFDIGAHQGIVALILAAEVGTEGLVIAVEADPHNARVAQRNVDLNRADNVRIVAAAISERAGTVYFAEGLNGHVDARTRVGNVEVPAVTIDDLAQHHGAPDVVFIDVEGYESKALEGASAILREVRATFFVEVHARKLVDCTVEELVGIFSGYRILVSEPGPDGQARGFAGLGVIPTAARFYLIATPA
jgi:FkbM family methyltransferase